MNRPLKLSTVDAIKNIIMAKVNEIDSWDMATIVWSFSKFKGYPSKELYKGL